MFGHLFFPMSGRCYSFFLLVLFTTAVCSHHAVTTGERYQYMEILYPDKIAYIYKLRYAENFGTQFSYTHPKVHLVVGRPDDGCTTLLNDHMMIHGAIVLLKKGKCTFVSKSRNAEEAGAIAVIIADDNQANDNEYISMIEDNTGRIVTIPAFFLLGKDGWMISKNLKDPLQPAIVNIPINITRIPMGQLHMPPWTLW